MNNFKRNHAVTAIAFLTWMITPATNAQLLTRPSPIAKALSEPLRSPAILSTAVADATQPPGSPDPTQASNLATPQRSHLEDLGDLYIARKRYVDAVNAYQATTGNSPVVWNKLGIAYQHLFNNKSARSSYEQSLRLNPRYPEALNNLGTILYAEKNYGGAARYYNKALKLSPHSAVIYANLGAAQFAKGDYKRGAKSYREAFTIDPNVFQSDSANKIQEAGSREARAMLNFHLAKFYARARMNARALECLREALDNGFHDRKKLMADEELAELRETQEFRQLLTLQGLH